MSANAPARPVPTSSPQLDFYRTRDDFMRTYRPATEEERLLVTQMARAWMELQTILEMRAQFLQRHSLLDLFENDLERYKLLHRSMTDGERMWRNAVEMFQRARRKNQPTRTSARNLSTGRPRPQPAIIPAPPAEAATDDVRRAEPAPDRPRHRTAGDG